MILIKTDELNFNLLHAFPKKAITDNANYFYGILKSCVLFLHIFYILWWDSTFIARYYS